MEDAREKSHTNGTIRVLPNDKREAVVSPFRVSIFITMMYAVVGSLWIILSDKTAVATVADKNDILMISTIKGLGYVAVTAFAFFLGIRHTLRRIEKTEKSLYKSNCELQETNTKLMSLYDELAFSEENLRQQYETVTAYQDKLHDMAYQEFITGLQNRIAFFEKFEHLVNADPQARNALLLIDLDNFKNINDTVGHHFGDLFIKAVGQRILEHLYEGNEIFKLCGDEFVVALFDLQNMDAVTEQANKIIQCFSEPIMVNGTAMHVTISMGVSFYPEHGFCADELLKNADIAMYRAKDNGKNRYVIYHDSMHEALIKRMAIEKNLRTALAKKEFYLNYQPQYDVARKKITGYEALIRWRSPELGFVSPGDFISIAEANYMIIPIGDWVLKEACIFLKRLQDKWHQDITMAVNISILQLERDEFVENVFNLLEEIDLDPRFLELEITESIMIERFDTIVPKLVRLREKGIKIALDDFGKGYSSLNSLQQLALDIIKIDKTFIDNIPDQEKNYLIEIIIAIGRRLGLEVLAEGVETKEQLDYLEQKQCNKVQGYYLSKPLKQEDAEAILAMPEVIDQ